jgi:hydroxymethylglutaryl-CoA reductase
MNGSRYPGFHRLAPNDRLARLEADGWLDAVEAGVLREELAPSLDGISENVVAGIRLPVGLVANMVVNGKPLLVPLATEEASVVAACTKAAGLAALVGGVTAVRGERRIGAQVLFRTTLSSADVQARLDTFLPDFKRAVSAAHPRLAAAGGGIQAVTFEAFNGRCPGAGTFLLLIDPVDAMGANLATSIAEQFAREIQGAMPGEGLGAIVTNYPLGRPAAAHVHLPHDLLSVKGMEGKAVGERIEALSRWAGIDDKRAITHNKGILNGISGVLAALYQDTRAAIAALDAHACRKGRMTPLATWELTSECLVGRFEGPIVCGTVGGTGPHRPTTAPFMKLMRIAEVGDLEEAVASVGLLQNLGALLAMATTGIMPTHRKLHERKVLHNG